MKPFFVYMLRCRDGSYYVGHTDDLETRVAQHEDGTFGSHTSRKRPLTLVWCAELCTRDEALERELQVKNWSRAKKEALIREDWEALKDLARGMNVQDRIRRYARPRPSTSREADASHYARGERGNSRA